MALMGKLKNNRSSMAVTLAYALVPQSKMRNAKLDTEEG